MMTSSRSLSGPPPLRSTLLDASSRSRSSKLRSATVAIWRSCSKVWRQWGTPSPPTRGNSTRIIRQVRRSRPRRRREEGRGAIPGGRGKKGGKGGAPAADAPPPVKPRCILRTPPPALNQWVFPAAVSAMDCIVETGENVIAFGLEDGSVVLLDAHAHMPIASYGKHRSGGSSWQVNRATLIPWRSG